MIAVFLFAFMVALLFELDVDSPGRRSGKFIHLVLDIRFGLGLPGDLAQYLNQSVNIRLVVLKAQAHPGEARQRDLRKQGYDHALKSLQ